MAVLCRRFADQSTDHADALAPHVERYGEDKPEEPDRLHGELFGGTRSGGLGLLRDLHDTRMKQAAPQALVVAD